MRRIESNQIAVNNPALQHLTQTLDPDDRLVLQHKESGMKVKIDYDLCMGDRNCNKVCPDVFEYDEDQLVSRVLVDEVPRELEDLVRKAARECAPGAITVEE